MKTYEEYERHARLGRPFPNSTEWEVWQYSVCLGHDTPARACVHDRDPEDGGGCPLILLMLEDKTPAEWRRGGSPGCSEKTTPAEARRAEREAAEAAEREAREAEHYPMFAVGELGEGVGG